MRHAGDQDRASGAPPRARKRFGQHFLERPWADRVLRAIAPAADDVFLEIGPGRGALTHPLAAIVRHLVAFEIDRDLVRALRQDGPDNLTVVEGDFLDVTPAAVLDALAPFATAAASPLKIAGNLPYNVAAPILFKCLGLYRAGLPVVDAVVMVQSEVADRILSGPNTRDYGVLSVLLQREARIGRLLALPAGAFRPPPQVRSTLLRLAFHAPVPAVRDDRRFESLVRGVFTRRRKMLANALAALPEFAPPRPLSALEALENAQIDPHRRPETLELDEFARLSDVIGELTRTRSGGPPPIEL